MKKLNYPAFQNHLEDYLNSLNEKFYINKIAHLAEELNKKLKTQVGVRAIRKWMDGETYPDTEKLIALSEIFNCTVDDLLKDKKETIRFKDGLPEWYENLSEQSKKIVLDALEPYRTGKIHEFEKRIIENFAALCEAKETNRLPFYSGLIPFRLFFDVTKTENDFHINTKKYYTHTEMTKKEIEAHQRKLQIELLKSYPNNLPKHSISYNPNHPEELLRVIDIGYTEIRDIGKYANYYLKPYEYDDLDENGFPQKMTREEQQTDSWNEITYVIKDDGDLLSDYKDRLPKLEPLEKYLEEQKQLIEKQYFQELLDVKRVQISYKTDYIEFGQNEFDFDTSKEYFETRGFLILSLDEIQNILIYEYKKALDINTKTLNEKVVEGIETIKRYRELFKLVGIEDPFDSRIKQGQNNEDDA